MIMFLLLLFVTLILPFLFSLILLFLLLTLVNLSSEQEIHTTFMVKKRNLPDTKTVAVRSYFANFVKLSMNKET